MPNFACLTHSKLKSWEQLRAANAHNVRAIDAPNARVEGHPPVELLDASGPLDDRVRHKLTEKNIDPDVVRLNAVLACEDVFQASHGYWAERYPNGWWSEPVEEVLKDPFMLALKAYLEKKHGDRLVSLCVHLDEKTPHLHCVSVPLVLKLHRIRGRKRKDGVVPAPVEKWSLDARTLRGGSKYRLEKEHDDWAAEVAHLGLVRGERGSELSVEEQKERKRRPRYASLENEKREKERKSEEQQLRLDLERREEAAEKTLTKGRRMVAVGKSARARAARDTREAREARRLADVATQAAADALAQAACRERAADHREESADAREEQAAATIRDSEKQRDLFEIAKRDAEEATRCARADIAKAQAMLAEAHLRDKAAMERSTAADGQWHEAAAAKAAAERMAAECARERAELTSLRQELTRDKERQDEEAAERARDLALREAEAARLRNQSLAEMEGWLSAVRRTDAEKKDLERRERLWLARQEAQNAFWSGEITGTSESENGPSLAFAPTLGAERRRQLVELTKDILIELCDWVGRQTERIKNAVKREVATAVQEERQTLREMTDQEIATARAAALKSDALSRAISRWSDGTLLRDGRLFLPGELDPNEKSRITAEIRPAINEAQTALSALQTRFETKVESKNRQTHAFDRAVELMASGVLIGAVKYEGCWTLKFDDTDLSHAEVQEARRRVKGAEHLIGPYIKSVESKVASGVIRRDDRDFEEFRQLSQQAVGRQNGIGGY